MYHIPFPPNYPIDDTTGDWHDRYRFRIMMNQQVVDPDVEAKMLQLIDRYKPVSRWPEAVVRPEYSLLDIYVAAVASYRITRVSRPPPIR